MRPYSPCYTERSSADLGKVVDANRRGDQEYRKLQGSSRWPRRRRCCRFEFAQALPAYMSRPIMYSLQQSLLKVKKCSILRLSWKKRKRLRSRCGLTPGWGCEICVKPSVRGRWKCLSSNICLMHGRRLACFKEFFARTQRSLKSTRK